MEAVNKLDQEFNNESLQMETTELNICLKALINKIIRSFLLEFIEYDHLITNEFIEF
jgi:hypothetical protein